MRRLSSTPGPGSRRVAIGSALAVIWLVLGTANVIAVAALGLPLDVVLSPDLAAGVAASAMALLIIRRAPHNRVGWVFLVIGAASSTWGVATLLLMNGMHPTGPIGSTVAWLATWAYYPAYALAFGVVPLIFPDGHLPTRRWIPVAWGVGTVIAAQMTLEAFGQATAAAAPVVNPWFVPALGMAATMLEPALDWAWRFAVVVAAAAMVARFRGAAGTERAQLLWLSAAAVIGVGALLAFQRGVVLIVALPVASAIAIVRHRLFDIETIARRAIVYGGLAAAASAVYVAIVVGIGTLPGRSSSDLRLIFVATAVMVILLQPLHRWLLGVARRLVYGARSSPYEAISDLTARVGAAMSADEVLPAMTSAVAAALPVDNVEVRVWLPDGSSAHARHHLEPVLDESSAHRVAIGHGGQEVGELLIRLAGDVPPSPSERGLLDDLAAAAGPALRSVALTAELELRLEELTEQTERLRLSRSRLVAAEDAARQRIERDIHDGAQQQLLALAVEIGRAERLVDRAPGEASTLLRRLQERTAATLAELRALASGTYPPVLGELGVGAALRARMTETGADVLVTDELRRRLDEPVEAALYFAVLEAVQNATKHSNADSIVVALRDECDAVSFIVRDDGDGFQPGAQGSRRGLQNIADRIEAVGGSVSITSEPGRGTAVAGRVSGVAHGVPAP